MRLTAQTDFTIGQLTAVRGVGYRCVGQRISDKIIPPTAAKRNDGPRRIDAQAFQRLIGTVRCSDGLQPYAARFATSKRPRSTYRDRQPGTATRRRTQFSQPNRQLRKEERP